MRGIRGLVVCTAAIGLLTAGAVSASMQFAHADTVITNCLGAADSTVPFQCALTATINDPATATVTVTDQVANAYDDVKVNWTIQCTDNANGTMGTAGAPAGSATPVTLGLTLPTNAADGQCAVSATVNLAPPFSAKSSSTPSACVTPTATPTATPTPTSTSTSSPTPCPTEFKATLSDTSAASPTPSSSPAPVHPVKGFGGKCVDDKGNSSANRAAIVIWSCSGSDQAENWKFSGGEFIHNGKCMNDKGDGGSGSKVILYSCNGGSNEKWTALTNGELKLQAHGGTLCLDDPRSSTTNGTQLIVYHCKDSANQKWSHP